METLGHSMWRLAVNFFQLLVFLCWCFFADARDIPWLWFATLLAALIALIKSMQYVQHIYRALFLNQLLSIFPSKEIQAERKRIAADLHDTLGSQLVQALVLMEDGGRCGLITAKQVLEQSLLDLRLIVDSMDAQEDSLTLRMARLRRRLEPVLRRKQMVLHWSICDPDLGIGRGTCELLPLGKTAHHILAVVQESIINAIQHAHATDVWVSLEPFDVDDPQSLRWSWRLCIEDNGVGINPQLLRMDSRLLGRGIANICARTKQVGGEVEIQQRRGGGTRVCVRWHGPNKYFCRMRRALIARRS